MAAFEKYLEEAGCIQCRADEVLALPPEEMIRVMEEELRENPLWVVVGRPSPEKWNQILQAGMREMRIYSRVMLLEPHECGKGGDHDSK